MFFDRRGVTPSYGPGRYDTRYELDGIDYPAGYVRWTDNRSLSAVNARQKFGLANGASGTIVYLTGGNVRYPKETMDATGGGRNARLDNFDSLIAATWATIAVRESLLSGRPEKVRQ